MARRKTLSPRDEFGNRFVTYTNITPEAVLAQPDLRTTKQSVQTQRIAENNGGGSSALSDDSIGPSSSVSSISVPSLSMDQDADNVNSPTSEGDNAAKTAQSLNSFANVMSVASAFNPIAGIPGAIARVSSASLQASRQGKTLEEYVIDQGKSFLGIKGASRQAFDAIQTAQINQEPEAGYRSTGNPKGSFSNVSDVSNVNAGEGNRGGLEGPEGPTTRGPSAIGYAPSLESDFSNISDSFGIGGDPSDAPGSGDDSEGIP